MSDYQEPHRASLTEPGAHLWIPFAIRIDPPMKVQGLYKDHWPKGAVVHFTAGRRGKGRDTIAFGREQGHAYLVIDAAGEIFQSHPMDSWGYHAGESKWPTLGTGVSRFLVGIEVMAAGELTKLPDGTFKTWFGARVPAEEVRSSGRRDNISPGHYQAFTQAQEDALEGVLLWMKRANPGVFDLSLVLGHDETCYPLGRKTDPGASLSCSMPEFRAKLRLAYEGHR